MLRYEEHQPELPSRSLAEPLEIEEWNGDGICQTEPSKDVQVAVHSVIIAAGSVRHWPSVQMTEHEAVQAHLQQENQEALHNNKRRHNAK
mmetsp:Transcript_66701/g.115947  ORF Transcript_66701/g.115947 Transcript_66701/m.115947 type:complete len:90 (-) Transcript_66701:44-313(-)